jgi:hypothetical protein
LNRGRMRRLMGWKIKTAAHVGGTIHLRDLERQDTTLT